MRDIYDPPPARMTLQPQSGQPLYWTGRDLVWLGMLVGLCLIGAYWAWTIEPVLWPTVLVGGLFVALESWFSALTFLHRHPDAPKNARGKIFLAAMAPWALGLGLAAALMVGLFAVTDWVRF
jgi:hypothetical protein